MDLKQAWTLGGSRLPLLIIDEAINGKVASPLRGRFTLQALAYLAQSEARDACERWLTPAAPFRFSAGPLGPSSEEFLKAVRFLSETGLIEMRSVAQPGTPGVNLVFLTTEIGLVILRSEESARQESATQVRGAVSRYIGLSRQQLLSYLSQHHPSIVEGLVGYEAQVVSPAPIK